MTTNERVNLYIHQVLPHIPFGGEQFAKGLDRLNMFDAPASIKYHGAWPGGWFDHSLCVMQQLVLLTDRNGLTWQRPESPYIVGFFHDLCKLDQYVRVRDDEDGKPVYAWKGDTLFKGHGDKSVIMLAALGAAHGGGGRLHPLSHGRVRGQGRLERLHPRRASVPKRVVDAYRGHDRIAHL